MNVKRCKGSCGRYPSYNYKGKAQPLYCVQCKLDVDGLCLSLQTCLLNLFAFSLYVVIVFCIAVCLLWLPHTKLNEMDLYFITL
eukprot:Pgem_evm1s11816